MGEFVCHGRCFVVDGGGVVAPNVDLSEHHLALGGLTPWLGGTVPPGGLVVGAFGAGGKRHNRARVTDRRYVVEFLQSGQQRLRFLIGTEKAGHFTCWGD